MNDLKAEVIRFVSQSLEVSLGRLDARTRLREDLGLDGYDAIEFFKGFSRKFEVDSSKMDFRKHFGPGAGLNPLWSLLRTLAPRTVENISKDLGRYPTTMNHLVLVAEKKRCFFRSAQSVERAT